MAQEKTIIEVWGGEEPLQTSYGPVHYIMVRFLEDPDRKASIGVKKDNLERTRGKLTSLIERRAEFSLELKDNGNYKILDYPGKTRDSELRILEGPGEGSPSNSSSPPLPVLNSDALMGVVNELDTKLDALINMVQLLLTQKGGGSGGGEAPGLPLSTDDIADIFDATEE